MCMTHQVTIIPGNLNSASDGKKGIFQQLLALEAEEREGQQRGGTMTRGQVTSDPPYMSLHTLDSTIPS